MAAAAAPRLQKPKEEAPRPLPTSATPRAAPQSSRPSNPARSSLVAVGPTSSGVVDLASSQFAPTQSIADEIEASKNKGLDVRVIAKGIAQEGRIKVRQNSKKKYVSMGRGSMPLLNPWTQKLGGMFLNFDIENSGVKNGLASFKEKGGDRDDWLQVLKKNSTALGGLGLKINNLPKPFNKFENGILALGVSGMKVGVGNYLDASFDLTLENLNAPKIIGIAEINIGGAEKNKLTLESNGDKLTGSVSLATTYKSFSGSIKVSYLADGNIDIAGKAAYSADKLSGEITFVATDEATANKFAKDAIAAAGGKENVQNAGAPAPVPAAKPGNKKRSLAAAGLLNFNLTKWFAGTVNVVVDGKGMITVIGKIAPPGEIILFKQRDWDKQLIKFEAKAYYGIPVVGNLNLFANISLNALAKLGPAKLYNIEILGTYSTDPEVQKNIEISGSINISAYAGLRLRAEGGAGIEILDHDLKFGVGLQADIGVKAYADARPTIGYRDPGEFYISGTLDMVAQPMLGLGGDFFIAIETPWWSPLSDDRWTWPLFSKEWPLTDPIGLSATVKDYVLGSGNVPEIEFKKPEFDPSKFMTNMVDDNLPNKSGKGGDGKGAFKEDGSVKKPVVPPKKNPAKLQPANKGGKKGAGAKAGKSGKPNADAAKAAANTKQLQLAAKKLNALKSKGPFARGDLDKELAVIRAQASGASFDVQAKGAKWRVTPKPVGKKPNGVDIGAKGAVDDKRSTEQKRTDLHQAILAASQLAKQPGVKRKSIGAALDKIGKQYRLTRLQSEKAGQNQWTIVGAINPIEKSPLLPDDQEKPNELTHGPVIIRLGDVIIARHVELKMRSNDKERWIPGTVTTIDIAKKKFSWASSNLTKQRTATYYAKEMGVKWKQGRITQIIKTEAQLLELNEQEKWDDKNDARAVLNWRRHNFPTNPPGKQWEHIIEQSSGGNHSSGNLAITLSTVNNRLGVLFGYRYASHEAPAGMKGTDGQILRDAIKNETLFVRNIWKQFFYKQMGLTLKWGSPAPRGVWRELS